MKWMILIFLAAVFVIWDVTQNDSRVLTAMGALFTAGAKAVGAA
jgi:hypothetical protein